MKTVAKLIVFSAIAVFAALLFLRALDSNSDPGSPRITTQDQSLIDDLKQLEAAFKEVAQFENAAAANYRSYAGQGRAGVHADFILGHSVRWQGLREYYDAELAQYGWVFRSEGKSRDYGRDLGGMDASYCKVRYEATLEFAGEKSTTPNRFSLHLAAGKNVAC